MITRLNLVAFLYGVVGANGFLVPIEAILTYAGAILAIVFAVFWTYMFVWIGVTYRFYTKAVWAYSIGLGTGIVANLLYIHPYIQSLMGF